MVDSRHDGVVVEIELDNCQQDVASSGCWMSRANPPDNRETDASMCGGLIGALRVVLQHAILALFDALITHVVENRGSARKMYTWRIALFLFG